MSDLICPDNRNRHFVISYVENSTLGVPECKIIVDTKTGVNYRLVASKMITPLIDNDGKPIISNLGKNSDT